MLTSIFGDVMPTVFPLYMAIFVSQCHQNMCAIIANLISNLCWSVYHLMHYNNIFFLGFISIWVAGFFTQAEFFFYHLMHIIFILFYLEFEIWTEIDKLDRYMDTPGDLQKLGWQKFLSVHFVNKLLLPACHLLVLL